MAGQEGRCEVWLHTAALSICSPSIPSNRAHTKEEVSFLRGHWGKAVEVWITSAFITFFFFGGGAAGNDFLRKKAILGQAYLRNTFFYFLSALSISGITGLCQEACSRAELRTCVRGSWELGGRGEEGGTEMSLAIWWCLGSRRSWNRNGKSEKCLRAKPEQVLYLKRKC